MFNKEECNLTYELKQLYLNMEAIADKIDELYPDKDNGNQLRGAAKMIKDDWIINIKKSKN